MKNFDIIIENVIRRKLNEAVHPFDVKELESLSSFQKRVTYCHQKLGNPIGYGSSRIVFLLNDRMVIKLAKNSKGIAQNESEGEYKNDFFSELFPIIYYQSNDNSLLISEFVLPAKPADFKHCFGVGVGQIMELLIYINSYVNGTRDKVSKEIEELYMETVNTYNNLENFINNIENYFSCNPIALNDLRNNIRNWGLAQRNGEDTMVVLDSGFDEDVYDKYYKRR